MKDKRTCPQCGTERSNDSLAGLCPKCLVQFSFVELEHEGSPRSPGDSPTPFPPSRFGDYENLEEIAHGGMGVVYRALQTSLHRTVALKMVAAGQLASPTAAQRFKTEAESAANLDHPNIVPIYEIGEVDGQHYFTMKMVEGASLAERLPEFTLASEGGSEPHKTAIFRSRAHNLAALLAKVAEAVHYAHQRGILHRDLKPGNILIDESGLPHVTDFGLAKQVEADTELTVSGEIMGTPAYMAPEQAAGKVRQITTAADVFSLGAILYQLLTGRVPFQGTTPVEVLHAVIHEEPATPRVINPNVPRDLETICLKCLEKDSCKRCGSAKELADELERFVNGEPILARPVGHAEKAWRWSRRNPALAAVSAATSILLITVLVGAPLTAWRQAQLRRQAEAEASKSQQVAQFLKDMLEGVGPSKALGRDTAMLQEILDKTAERVAQDLADQPDVEAELLQTLGETAFLLGDFDKAEAWLSEALSLREEVFGKESAEVANSLDALALAFYGQGSLEEAERVGREALDLQKRNLGGSDSKVATSLNNLGITLTVAGRWDEAVTVYQEALTIRTNQLGEEHAEVAVTLNCLAQALLGQGDLRKAEEAQRRALEIQRELLPDPHPDLALSLNNLANLLQVRGKLDQAEPHYRDTLRMQRALLGNNHPDLATTLNNYGLLLNRMGLWQESEAAHMQALGIRTNSYAGDHLHVAFSLVNLAGLRADMGQLQEAEQLQRRALEMRRGLLNEENADVAASIGNLARVLRLQGRLDEAETMQNKALARRRNFPPAGEHLSIAVSLNEHGLLKLAQDQPVEAARILRQAYQLRTRVLYEDDSSLAESAENLALVLCDLGEFAEAEKLARQSLGIRAMNYPDGWRRYNTVALVGAALLGQQRYEDAETLLLSGYRGMKERESRIPAPEKSRLQGTLECLAQLHEATDRLDQAAIWRKELTRAP